MNYRRLILPAILLTAIAALLLLAGGSEPVEATSVASSSLWTYCVGERGIAPPSQTFDECVDDAGAQYGICMEHFAGNGGATSEDCADSYLDMVRMCEHIDDEWNECVDDYYRVIWAE